MTCPRCGPEAVAPPPAPRPAAPRSLARRSARAIRWIAPGAALAVMPKCPACLAGYVALWTGIGLSTPAAAWVRATLIGLCVASLAFLLARQGLRLAPLRRVFPARRSAASGAAWFMSDSAPQSSRIP